MVKYKKCKNCGEDIFFQKKWNKWYHNNGKKHCSKQYPQVQIAEPNNTYGGLCEPKGDDKFPSI